MSPRWLTTVMAAFAATALSTIAFAAPGAKTPGPKARTAHATKPAAAKVPVMKSTGPKTTTKAKPIKVNTTTKAAGGPKASKTKSTTSVPAKTSKKTATSTTTPAAWTPNNPVAQKLSTKANLLSKVTNSLPPGTDLNAATAGFKNFGQFVAAVNVSNNLGISFADLKSNMTGFGMDGLPTGESPVSLGRAIQELKPAVDANVEATKAQTLAEREIR